MMAVVSVVLVALSVGALALTYKKFRRRAPAQAADRITSMP